MEVIAEDSDSGVHLDYSSDSLRSEKGRLCGRGQFVRGQGSSETGRLPPALERESEGHHGGFRSQRSNRALHPVNCVLAQSSPARCHFERSTPVLKQRGLGLQRSVSDVVEAEFPSPFSDSRSHF